MAHKYRKNLTIDYGKGKNIGTPGGTPIIVTDDGTIRANRFVDTTDNFEFFMKNGRVKCRTSSSINTERILDVESGTVLYKATRSYATRLKNCFFHWGNKVRNLTLTALPRFFHLKKMIKKTAAIVKAQGSPFALYFKGPKDEEKYARPYVTQNYFKAYNVPIYLQVEGKAYDFNDLLVVSTGQFRHTPSGQRSGIHNESVVYVSPHSDIPVTGYVPGTRKIQPSGSNGLVSYSGGSGYLETSTRQSFRMITSRMFEIPSGNILSGGATYVHFNRTGTASGFVGEDNVRNTAFYNAYTGISGRTGQLSKIYNGKWDGVIPSGTPFKIEVWSCNGQKHGFAGTIKGIPTGGVREFEIDVSGSGIGKSHISMNDAIYYAQSKASRQLLNRTNMMLTEQGFIPTGHALKRWVSFLKVKATGV